MSFPAILCPSAACVRKLSFGFFFFKNINCPLARATAGAGSTNQPINQHFEFFIIGGRGERERERTGGKEKKEREKTTRFFFSFYQLSLAFTSFAVRCLGERERVFFLHVRAREQSERQGESYKEREQQHLKKREGTEKREHRE